MSDLLRQFMADQQTHFAIAANPEILHGTPVFLESKLELMALAERVARAPHGSSERWTAEDAIAKFRRETPGFWEWCEAFAAGQTGGKP